MGGDAGGAWKPFLAVCALAFAITVIFVGPLAGKAAARAELQNYLQGPNLFYPARYDQPGPTNLTIQTVGWNVTRLAGNVGIGNGSVRTFDQTHTFDVEYPLHEFMCGDVSQQPWIPGLKTEPPKAEAAAEESETGSTAGHNVAPAANATSPELPANASDFAVRQASPDVTGSPGTAGNETGNRTRDRAANESRQAAANNMALIRSVNENQAFDAFHPIQYLNPVRDLLYEHPLSTSGCTYCQLLGFQPPAGPPVNVGMKCTGYGY